MIVLDRKECWILNILRKRKKKCCKTTLGAKGALRNFTKITGKNCAGVTFW